MKQRNLLLILALASLAFFLMGNSLLPITDPVESNYALTAKEMVLSGDWVSPRIYGIFWYDKPIFLYWLLCLSYSVFGFTDFASRLPGGIFGMASVVMTAWFVLRRYGRTAPAILAAAMSATSLEVWAISHSVITDQMLYFFTAGTMFYAYIGLTEGKSRYIIGAYAMAGLAVLTKGPVGLVLPGLFLLVFAAVQRNLTYVKRLFPPLGLAAFVIVALPWYGAMYYLHGQEFIDGFLGLNNVVRATVSEHPQMNVWYYYLVLVPVSLLPWTGPCLYAFWKRRSRSDYYVFMAIWTIGTILFYSFMATKYPTYSYIANIPLLLLGTDGILDLYEAGRRRLWTWVTAPAIFYWLLFFAATFFLKGNTSWAVLYTYTPIAIALVLFSQWKRAYLAIPILICIGTIVLYSIILPKGLAPYYQYRSSASSVEAAQLIQGPLYIFGDYRTSFVYYTGVEAIFVDRAGHDKNAELKRSSVWSKKHLYKEDSAYAVAEMLDQRQPLSILVPENSLDEYALSQLYNKTRLVGQFGRNYLFVNQ